MQDDMDVLGTTTHRNDLISAQKPRDSVDHGPTAEYPFFRGGLGAPGEGGAES